MSEFTGVATVTLQTWLTAAQTALQSLSIGAQVVSVSTADGKRVSFTAADSDKLRRYILRLQQAIAIAQGTTSSLPYSVATWTR